MSKATLQDAEYLLQCIHAATAVARLMSSAKGSLDYAQVNDIGELLGSQLTKPMETAGGLLHEKREIAG